MDHDASGQLAATRRISSRADWPAAAAWMLACAPVLYLGLRGGGYDAVVRGEVGIAIWWLLLVGALAGILPAVRPGRAALALVGAFALFTVWTGLGITWSASAERGVLELARVVTYLGILVLAVAALDARTARSALHGAAVACAAIGLLAVLSRIRPEWLPASDLIALLEPGAGDRLSYPLNSSDGVGSFAAIGIPVLLAAAITARTIVGRAISVSAVPVLLLMLYLSNSRGGLLAAVVGLLVWIALAPDRLPRLATLGFAGAGGAVLLAAAADRLEFRQGLSTALAHEQADEMLVYLVVVCAAVALLQSGVALALRHGNRPAWSRPSRRAGFAVLAAVVAMSGAGGLLAGAPDLASEKWREFQSAERPSVSGTDLFSRLDDLSGNNRFQYWESAVHGWETDRLKGIGSGGFELWWARDGAINEFIRDAHSLYVETLVELGLVGVVLLVTCLLLMLGLSGAGALRRGPLAGRAVAAGATAGLAAFAAGATVNWSWEISVMPMLALLLVAMALAAARGEPATCTASPAQRWRRPRLVIAVLSAIAIGLVVVPLASTNTLRESQAGARAGDLAGALRQAAQAQRLQPYASTPRLQRALILERAGALGGAGSAIGEAVDRSPEDWRLWLVRSRIEAKRGDAGASVAAYRQARSLNPRSRLFAR